MNMLDSMLAFNDDFVKQRSYEELQTDKFPDKGFVILSCMDARLVELLPRALGIKNGDVKLIKNAGALVTSPWGSVMRSLLVAVYALGAKEILIIGHHDCGMSTLNSNDVLKIVRERGIKEETISTLRYAGIDLESWLKGFDNVEDSVRITVKTVRNHPLLPADVPVHGLIIDPNTGQLDMVINGYHHMKAPA
jgi:carbonic anhydrase